MKVHNSLRYVAVRGGVPAGGAHRAAPGRMRRTVIAAGILGASAAAPALVLLGLSSPASASPGHGGSDTVTVKGPWMYKPDTSAGAVTVRGPWMYKPEIRGAAMVRGPWMYAPRTGVAAPAGGREAGPRR